MQKQKKSKLIKKAYKSDKASQLTDEYISNTTCDLDLKSYTVCMDKYNKSRGFTKKKQYKHCLSLLEQYKSCLVFNNQRKINAEANLRITEAEKANTLRGKSANASYLTQMAEEVKQAKSTYEKTQNKKKVYRI